MTSGHRTTDTGNDAMWRNEETLGKNYAKFLSSDAGKAAGLTPGELEEISKSNSGKVRYTNHSNLDDQADLNKVHVLYFNYKTYMNEVYKVKETGTGADKIIMNATDGSASNANDNILVEARTSDIACYTQAGSTSGTGLVFTGVTTT